MSYFHSHTYLNNATTHFAENEKFKVLSIVCTQSVLNIDTANTYLYHRLLVHLMPQTFSDTFNTQLLTNQISHNIYILNVH